ncbi:hypothetical protein BGZ60DRAFT_561933 [Tricladium varicosporioides]|nr:hypothetical protein BGZ60DRAFT_561933 [Hymenoscyphus varicosporioides]
MIISIVVAAFATITTAHPKLSRPAQHYTRSEEISPSYDYIVIGGGTSGLTVADRLTEVGKSTVLVVEYGYFEKTLQPDDFTLRSGIPPQMIYNITSVGTKKIRVGVGSCVGGSSAVNLMIFMRGTSEDYDLWDNLGEYGGTWSWDSLLPYFKKSATFIPPQDQLAKDFHIDYDVQKSWGLGGGTGPIQASWPSFFYPSTKIMRDAWKYLPGVAFPKDGSEGKAGVIWVPTSIDPKNGTRSYARTGHYERVKNRTNYHLLVGHKATKIEFSKRYGSIKADSVTITSRSDNKTLVKVSARKEIVLAAGAIHSPQVLQRSGVGPRELLASANITLVHEIPGVGQNFHDHSYFPIKYEYQNNTSPNPDMLKTNETFLKWAEELWATNRTGPASAVAPNIIAQLPLPVIAPTTYQFLADSLLTLDPASALPPNTHPTIVAGYGAQLKAMASAIRSNNTSWLQFPLHGKQGTNVNYMHPLSRGSVNINISDPDGEPVVDYRAFTNPVDLKINLALLKAMRNYYASDSVIQQLKPVEIIPGPNVTTDKEMIAWIETNMNPSTFHPVGTCAMLPLEYGGVVGEDLRVHGIEGLSVVDASIMPVIVGATTQSTVYAVAEKAADLIKARSSFIALVTAQQQCWCKGTGPGDIGAITDTVSCCTGDGNFDGYVCKVVAADQPAFKTCCKSRGMECV